LFRQGFDFSGKSGLVMSAMVKPKLPLRTASRIEAFSSASTLSMEMS